MPYGELYLPPEPLRYNPQNGQFLPGHTPHNKGKKWSEYVGKRAQKRMKKGWANLATHRPTSRPDTSGRCRKQVIAVMDDGTWRHFAFLGSAAEWVGGSRENVGRCCRLNAARHANKKTGKINTDHRYNGIRFYFEDDTIWLVKTNQI